ncbi:hypothetical protein FQR65_LT01414 [Abscondita terminalis]|nr:hypothetical protein FQR65_LT01414 [Abscondita terminalis]
MSESAYNSPLLNRRLTESCCSSPARSIGQQTPEVLTDSDGDSDFPLHTESPGVPDQTVISGWLKFRDNKKTVPFEVEVHTVTDYKLPKFCVFAFIPIASSSRHVQC